MKWICSILIAVLALSICGSSSTFSFNSIDGALAASLKARQDFVADTYRPDVEKLK